MTTQTVHIQTYDYGASLTSATLRAISTDALVATADTTDEVTADSGLYAVVFDEVTAIAAGTYRLRAVAGGQPINRYVTLAGVDAEVVQSRSERFAELSPNGITAAVLAADAVSEIQSGLATPTNITAATGITLAPVTHTGATIPTVTTITNGVTASTVTDKTGYTLTPTTGLGDQTADITGTVSGNSTHDAAAVLTALGNGSWATEAGGTGDQFTQIPWNAAWDSEVQSEVADALAVFWTSPAILVDLIWDEPTAGHTTAGTYGGRIVRSTNSNVEVQITGSNHIAADVHEFQTGVIVAGAFAANSLTAAALAADAVTEIQSGLATSAAVAAAKAILDKVDSGLIIDGAVYQFTANMLELGPSGGGGGSGTVNVLPATGIVADRSAGTTLLPVVGETISQAITVYQSDGTTAVNLSGKTLAIIFETMSGTDVAVVANANITISGVGNNVVTFAYPSAVTASERVLRFAIRDAAAPLTMYLKGVCSVIAAPKVDA